MDYLHELKGLNYKHSSVYKGIKNLEDLNTKDRIYFMIKLIENIKNESNSNRMINLIEEYLKIKSNYNIDDPELYNEIDYKEFDKDQYPIINEIHNDLLIVHGKGIPLVEFKCIMESTIQIIGYGNPSKFWINYTELTKLDPGMYWVSAKTTQGRIYICSKYRIVNGKGQWLMYLNEENTADITNEVTHYSKIEKLID